MVRLKMKGLYLIASLGLMLSFQNCGKGFESASQIQPGSNGILSVDVQLVELAATPAVIDASQSSVISWKATGASQVILNPGNIDVSNRTSYTVVPASTTEYSITASSASGSVISKLITVAVNPAAPVITSFTSSLASITSGQSATLNWAVTGATSLKLDPGNIALTGNSTTVSPTASTVYTLTATNAVGVSSTKTVSITVNAIPVPMPTITSFKSNSTSIVSGQSATLSWTTTSATSLKLNPGNIDVTGKTSTAVSPTSTTTYSLIATNTSGSVNSSVVVTVTQPIVVPVINSFLASNMTVVSGESTVLSWSVTGATSLKLDPGAVDMTAKTSMTYSPTATTTYTLTATNSGGSVSKAVTVVYIPPWTVSPEPTLTAGSADTYNLASTLPAGVKTGGVFGVDEVNGPKLPNGMALNATTGVITVGTAVVGTTTGMIFTYTEP